MMTEEQIERRKKIETAIGNLVDIIQDGEYADLSDMRKMGFNWTEANDLRNMVYLFARKNYISGTVS